VFADRQLCDVVLRDGSTLALRPVRETDVEALVTFFNALSPQSRYYRFFGVRALDRATVGRLVPSGAASGTALVGECARARRAAPLRPESASSRVLTSLGLRVVVLVVHEQVEDFPAAGN
jgi:hypothetical protein